MPELPDIQIYLERLSAHVGGKTLTGLRIPGPFLLRTVQPKPQEAIGRKIVGFRRLGKRIVFEMQEGLFLVLHLMIAGRLRWKPAGVAIPRKAGLAAFDFASGSLLLTEASTPGGISIESLFTLEKYAFKAALMEAIDSSIKRAEALSRSV